MSGPSILCISPRLRVVYLGVQGMLVPLWWAALLASSEARALFLPAAKLSPSFLALLLPDLVVIAGASFLAARLVEIRSRRATAALWLLCGGFAYATLYTVAWTFLVAAPPLGLLLMLAACAANALILRASL